MYSQTEDTKANWTNVTVRILLVTTTLAISAYLMALIFWPIGFIAWLIIGVGGMLFFIVRQHARNSVYRCVECSNEFNISALADFFSPHTPNSKYLKCPKCYKQRWQPEINDTQQKV
jgi:DNA-directed RNA polymerase subunit RPC12/RpoP